MLPLMPRLRRREPAHPRDRAGHAEDDVVVLSRLKAMIARRIGLLEAGEPWVLNNLDWEDDYVLRYDTILNEPPEG